MTPYDKALSLIRLALDPASSESEARTGALMACRLIDKHGLLDKAKEAASPPDTYTYDWSGYVRQPPPPKPRPRRPPPAPSPPPPPRRTDLLVDQPGWRFIGSLFDAACIACSVAVHVSDLVWYDSIGKRTLCGKCGDTVTG